MVHGLSIDVEEIYHAELVRRHVPAAQRASLIEAATEPILDLLAQRNVRATFFILGDVLRDHQPFVKAIAAAGHEIGCHGMTHRPLWELDAESFGAELRSFRTLWQGPQAVVGFRAPTFSLVQRTGWALAVLAAEGFTYDSSIFPVANYMYGVNGGPLAPYRPSPADLRREDAAGPIVELPMTVWPIAGRRLPVSGGFYLRALPSPVLLHALRQVGKERPIVLYLHPWEGYAGTPVVSGLSLAGRMITYYNRASVLPKLRRILSEFEFGPLCDMQKALA